MRSLKKIWNGKNVKLKTPMQSIAKEVHDVVKKLKAVKEKQQQRQNSYTRKSEILEHTQVYKMESRIATGIAKTTKVK